MNRYQQYMAENDLAYCSLYPNVGDVFPIELKSNSLVQICRLEQLSEVKGLILSERYYQDLEGIFNANDLCFCFQKAVILIQTWDGKSEDYLQNKLIEQLYLYDEGGKFYHFQGIIHLSFGDWETAQNLRKK